MRSVRNRARAPLLAALLLCFILPSCSRPDNGWEILFVDGEGNDLGVGFPHAGEAMAVFRARSPFTDQIALRFFYFTDNYDWMLISLAIDKPETPVLEVAKELYVEELPPGTYKIEALRNDVRLGEKIFVVTPPRDYPDPFADPDFYSGF